MKVSAELVRRARGGRCLGCNCATELWTCEDCSLTYWYGASKIDNAPTRTATDRARAMSRRSIPRLDVIREWEVDRRNRYRVKPKRYGKAGKNGA